MDPLWLRRIPQQQSQQWPVCYLLSQIQQHNNRRIGHLHIGRRTFMKFCFKVWSQIVECFMTFYFLSKSRDWEKRMPRDQDSLDALPIDWDSWLFLFQIQRLEKRIMPQTCQWPLASIFCACQQIKTVSVTRADQGHHHAFWSCTTITTPVRLQNNPGLLCLGLLACMCGRCVHAWLGVCCLYNITIWAKFSLHIIHWPRAIVALVNVMMALTVPLLFCQSSHVVICFAFSLGSQKAWL